MEMKLVQRGRCSAEVLCPAESLPVTHPSHHPSMVMSTPPAKTVNTELLVTHDFAIASILKKCFLKTSHSRLLTDEIVQRNTEPPLGQYAEKKRRQKRRGKNPYMWFYMAQILHTAIRLCRTFPTAPSYSWHIRERKESLNTARAGTVSPEYKI